MSAHPDGGDEDEPGSFEPPPPPEERPWRHPSELAATGARPSEVPELIEWVLLSAAASLAAGLSTAAAFAAHVRVSPGLATLSLAVAVTQLSSGVRVLRRPAPATWRSA